MESSVELCGALLRQNKPIFNKSFLFQANIMQFDFIQENTDFQCHKQPRKNTMKSISFCPSVVRLHDIKTKIKLPLLQKHKIQTAARLNSRWQTHNEGCNWNNISGSLCTSCSGIPAGIRPFSQIIPKRPANQNKTQRKEHNFTEQCLLMETPVYPEVGLT